MKTSITLTLNNDPRKFATAILGYQAAYHVFTAVREVQQTNYEKEVSLQAAWDYLNSQVALYQDKNWGGFGFFEKPTQEDREKAIGEYLAAMRDLENLSAAIGGDIEPAELP